MDGWFGGGGGDATGICQDSFLNSNLNDGDADNLREDAGDPDISLRASLTVAGSPHSLWSESANAGLFFINRPKSSAA